MLGETPRSQAFPDAEEFRLVWYEIGCKLAQPLWKLRSMLHICHNLTTFIAPFALISSKIGDSWKFTRMSCREKHWNRVYRNSGARRF